MLFETKACLLRIIWVAVRRLASEHKPFPSINGSHFIYDFMHMSDVMIQQMSDHHLGISVQKPVKTFCLCFFLSFCLFVYIASHLDISVQTPIKTFCLFVVFVFLYIQHLSPWYIRVYTRQDMLHFHGRQHKLFINILVRSDKKNQVLRSDKTIQIVRSGKTI